MPEGDTIWKAARALDRGLAGGTVTSFRTASPQVSPPAERAVRGRTVGAVTARGKHLLMTFVAADGDVLTLHTHLGMDGSWHIYRVGERWRRSAATARAVVETGGMVAACFDAPVVELLTAQAMATHPALVSLGPDAMADDLDTAEVVRRLRAHPDRLVGEALLDQRVVAGIGNVLRCEALFLAGVGPFAAVGSLSDEGLTALVRESARLLRLNREGGGRRTRASLDRRQRLWVYGRAGRPCYRCDAAIRGIERGDPARRVFWCPSCQPEGEASGGRGTIGK